MGWQTLHGKPGFILLTLGYPAWIPRFLDNFASQFLKEMYLFLFSVSECFACVYVSMLYA